MKRKGGRGGGRERGKAVRVRHTWEGVKQCGVWCCFCILTDHDRVTHIVSPIILMLVDLNAHIQYMYTHKYSKYTHTCTHTHGYACTHMPTCTHTLTHGHTLTVRVGRRPSGTLAVMIPMRNITALNQL